MQIIAELVIGISIIATLTFGAGAHGQESELDQLAKRLTMQLMAPDLYGGRPATEKELPTAVWLGFCTSHAVGNDVAKNKAWYFTASHCVETGQVITFKSRDGVQHKGPCQRHSNYDDRSVVWDFAICEVTPALPKDAPLASFDNSPVKVGDGVIMNGYGRPNIATLHLGSSVIYQVGTQDLITNTNVALGGGDSGSSLLRGPTDLEKGPFKIIGVNSRREVGGNRSYFNRIELDNTMKFFRDYAQSKGATLCGVNSKCDGAVIPPPELPDRCLADKAMVDYFKSELSMAENALAACVK